MDRRLACLLTLACTLFACKDEEPSKQGEDETPSRRSARQNPATFEIVDIVLVDPGAEPRQKLTYRFEPGMEQVMLLDSKITRRHELDEQKSEDLLHTRSQISVDVTGRGEDGFKLGFSVGAAELIGVEGELTGSIDELRKAIEGAPTIEGTFEVRPNGLTRDVQVGLPSDVSPAFAESAAKLKDMLRQILVPFPEEPVGSGARWIVHSKGRFQDFGFEQQGEHTLSSVDGNRLEVSAQSTMRFPSLPKGLRFEGSGAGTFTIDLEHPVAASTQMLTWRSSQMVQHPSGPKTAISIFDLEIQTHPR